MAMILLTASTCEKMLPGDYRDFAGNKTNLLGCWGLVEVQYRTAGVIETKAVDPETLMEFAQDGIGYTKTLDGEILDSYHYEVSRASVTFYTNAEWENNRYLGEDDPEYERGKTYCFHIIDADTISSEEKISSNSYLVNIYSRM